ncbi:MAG: hypothetical protein IJ737_06910 [Ruminococcus sp.]|nr:hypothetical protein [Ruminococcus sp.]
MEITDITSILGCITGSVSLFILLRQSIIDNKKAIVEEAPMSYTYYFDTNKCDNIYGWFDTKCAAVLSLQVTNPSKYPLCLTKAIIKNDKSKATQGNSFKHDRIAVCMESAEIKNSIGKARFLQSYNICDLPLTIAPYSSKCFALAFPFVYDMIEYYGEILNAQLDLHTARGKLLSIPVKIPEYFSHFSKINP